MTPPELDALLADRATVGLDAHDEERRDALLAEEPAADAEVYENLNILIESETQYVAKMSEATAFNDANAGVVFGSPKLASRCAPQSTRTDSGSSLSPHEPPSSAAKLAA